jgi:hypothetical protein
LPKGVFDWRGRVETNVSLAMLPVGLILGAVSAVGVPLLVGFGAVRVLYRSGDRDLLLALWAFASALLALRAAQLAVEALGGFNWRWMLRVLLLWGVVVALYPGWWFPAA